MNVVAIISELRRDLERIDGLILALEALSSGRRRGRPPKALQALLSGTNTGSSPVERQAAAAIKEAATQPATRNKKGRPAAKKSSKPKAQPLS
ncbi:MAG: hypothetical protein O3A53_07560 [Acidobacteria bacterium]|nr:hypothetical protein [Acidobacteriota bacterium]MDA1234641.1 hypothetical protein [Acidobacteriota bacterium]